jgi:hypothetical protein
MAKSRAPHLPPIQGSERAAKSFYLLGVNGEKLFPVRMRDSKTGRVAFRLAERGSGNNVRAKVIEVDDEAEACRMVASGNYRIRAQRESDRGPSLVRVGSRAVRKLVIVEP